MKDTATPAWLQAHDVRQRIGDAAGDDDPLGPVFGAIAEEDIEGRPLPMRRHDLAFLELKGRVLRQLGKAGGSDVGRRHAILAEEAVRGMGEAVAWPGIVDEQDIATCAYQRHGGRQTCKTAANDDDMMFHERFSISCIIICCVTDVNCYVTNCVSYECSPADPEPALPTDNRLSRMLHVLIHMERLDAPVTSEVIARMLSTNPVVVRRTMSGLKLAGHVTSEKGHGGGWSLTRPLSAISLLDIYTALDSPGLFSIGFSSDHGGCLVEAAVNATIRHAVEEAEALLLKRFGEVMLSDIAHDVDGKMVALGIQQPGRNPHELG